MEQCPPEKFAAEIDDGLRLLPVLPSVHIVLWGDRSIGENLRGYPTCNDDFYGMPDFSVDYWFWRDGGVGEFELELVQTMDLGHSEMKIRICMTPMKTWIRMTSMKTRIRMAPVNSSAVYCRTS